MISKLALFPVLGRPIFVFFGLAALIFFLAAAIIGRLSMKGKFSFKWHPRLALTAIILMLIHAFLGIAIFLRF